MSKTDKTKAPVINTERAVQSRIIRLLIDQHKYLYLGNLSEKENRPVIEELLREFLVKYEACTEVQASEAIRHLNNEIGKCTDRPSLYNANKSVYNLLRYPISVSQGIDKPHRQISLIDWEHPGNNAFHIAEEVTVARTSGESRHRRPDIVVYVNGIALAVLELKKATVSASDGIHQQIRNQTDGQIAPFFATAQLLLAGSESEGVYYGTILTPAEFYLRWKEPAGDNYPRPGEKQPLDPRFTSDRIKNELDRSLLQMLEPSRLLDFIHNCVVFDGGVKKVARPNQYFALQAARERVLTKEGGIIWHTQGSGKSLTMVWLAQWILENVDNSRIVIITDRDELDIQITNGFSNAGHHPGRATSGRDLIRILGESAPSIITTLIHKFGIAGDTEGIDDQRLRGKRSPEQYLSDVAARLPKDFKAKGNLFVFVDECHRTQSGILHKAMRQILGENVMFIGFTGTPLMRSDKARLTSPETFGPWISTYKFDEAVKDGVILDLRYEARSVEQEIGNPENLDALFETHTFGLSDTAKERLQQDWAQMQNLFSSRQRIERIVSQIYMDFCLIPALKEGWGNAMLVCDSIYQAFRFWNTFENNDYFKGHTAVVTSYAGQDIALGDGYTGGEKSEEEYKYNMFHTMRGDRSAEDFEAYAKETFIKEPGQMKILIVVDKLLTGFDAPATTYMYIDKEMRDHTLFQAICRVNRTNGERKSYGYIIDYKNLFLNIENAIEDYTNGGSFDVFASFDKEDVEGLLKSRLAKGKEDLEKALERVHRLSEPVALPRRVDDYFDYFCYNPSVSSSPEDQKRQIEENRQRREDFYDACHNLLRRYVAIATEMKSVGYTEEEAISIRNEVKSYDDIRLAIMHRAGDYIDFRKFNAEMRKLIDDYVNSTRVEVLGKLDDFSFLDLIIKDEEGEPVGVDNEAEDELGGERGVSETFAANVRRVVNRERNTNPDMYQRFSERLDRIIQEYQQGTIEYREFLKQILLLATEIKNRNHYDPRLDTELKRSLYDNLGHNLDLALSVYDVVNSNAEPGFRTSLMRDRKLKRALIAVLEGTDYDPDGIYQIVANNGEF